MDPYRRRLGKNVVAPVVLTALTRTGHLAEDMDQALALNEYAQRRRGGDLNVLGHILGIPRNTVLAPRKLNQFTH
jgi:hypothetical protein